EHPLRLVREENADYDIALFITDGHPNRPNGYGDNSPLNRAITAANNLKAAGTTILGVGVGSGIDANNIRAISGGGYYYTVANYGDLTDFLKNLAEEDCRGTVSVVKEVKNAAGVTAPAGGWEFSASSSTSGTTFDPASGITAASNG